MDPVCIFRDFRDGVFYCYAYDSSGPTFVSVCGKCAKDEQDDE
jgi:hypothetical protein